MRNELDLFVNVLHCTSKKGVKTRHENIDIAVVRQNTEGTCFPYNFLACARSKSDDLNNTCLIQ